MIFEYRFEMAEVIRDYGPADREEAPADSRRVHDREEGRCTI